MTALSMFWFSLQDLYLASKSHSGSTQQVGDTTFRDPEKYVNVNQVWVTSTPLDPPKKSAWTVIFIVAVWGPILTAYR